MAEQPPPSKPGPRIVTLEPIVMTIKYNEVTGQVDFTTTRDIPFHAIVMIFCTLLTRFIAAMTPTAPAPPGLKPGN